MMPPPDFDSVRNLVTEWGSSSGTNAQTEADLDLTRLSLRATVTGSDMSPVIAELVFDDTTGDIISDDFEYVEDSSSPYGFWVLVNGIPGGTDRTFVLDYRDGNQVILLTTKPLSGISISDGNVTSLGVVTLFVKCSALPDYPGCI